MLSKSELSDFLEGGWTQDAEIFFNGFIYRFNVYVIESQPRLLEFELWAFPAVKIGNGLYRMAKCPEGFEFYGRPFTDGDLESLKEKVLNAPFFGNKSFWEALPDLEWLDDGTEECLPFEDYLKEYPDAKRRRDGSL